METTRSITWNQINYLRAVDAITRDQAWRARAGDETTIAEIVAMVKPEGFPKR